MNSIYVIQDKSGYVVSATYEQQKALEICKSNEGYSYRSIPFYSCVGTVIYVIAGPIPKI